MPGRGPAIKICPKDRTEFGDDISFCPICGTKVVSIGLRKGEVVGGSYRVLELIGRGWAGAVYRAEHSMMGRPTALKVISSPVVADPAFVERFRKAAQLLSDLDHPNVAIVHDLGLEPPGRVFVASELVEGKSLAKILSDEGPMAGQRCLDVIHFVLDGLKSAHEMGIIHGSIKPSNIMIAADASGPRIVDFASARVVAALQDELFATVTPYETVYGQVEYLAPEQITGGEVTARTDIYAIGLMMYELLTGARPFRGDSAEEIAKAQVEEKPPSPREFKPQLKIPKFIEKAIMQALEKKPRKRQQSVGDLMEQLQAEIVPEEEEPKGVWQRARAAVLPPKPAPPRPAETPTAILPTVGAVKRQGAGAADVSSDMEGKGEGPRFILYDGKTVKAVYSVNKAEMLVGRSPDCDIFIDDQTVSRVHAKVVSKPEKIVVEDMNSLNGTYINEDAVKRGHIEHKDNVTFGNVTLVFRTS